MGHELVGTVAEPNDVDGVRVRNRVVVDPTLYCGICFYCQVGQTNLCPNGSLLGRDINGGFAEYIAIPTRNVFTLPDSIDNRTAAMIQVLTTCVHAQRLSDLFPDESVVVLGLGVAGQLHVQLAKARGAGPVIGLTRSPTKAQLAMTLGADLALSKDPDAAKIVHDATHGRGADLVIECTGMISSLSHAISLARSGGRIILFGITTAAEGSLPFYQLYFKELTVLNSRAANGSDFVSSINLVERGVIRLTPLLSAVMPLTQLGTALDILNSQDDQRLKLILEHV
jgi:threonine dehydrogenase-like Zn-dependent dehydrogenase